jgi:virginiamycin B lyase
MESPTPGSRPHGPLAAPDGTIWYTGHMGNLLGHIDPKRETSYHIHHSVRSAAW